MKIIFSFLITIILMFVGSLIGRLVSGICNQYDLEMICREQYTSYNDVIACFDRASNKTLYGFVRIELNNVKYKGGKSEN